MGKMVQIRNMPEKMHRKLKARAAEAGMSLSEYILRELRQSSEKLTPAEIWERVRALPPVPEPKQSSAAIIRELRGPLPEDE